jgi:hypothetical protein
MLAFWNFLVIMGETVSNLGPCAMRLLRRVSYENQKNKRFGPDQRLGGQEVLGICVAYFGQQRFTESLQCRR